MNWEKRAISSFALAMTVVGLGGCATILGGGSSQAVGIASDPTGAHFTIKSSSGLQMASGNAPQTVRLPRRNEYQIEFSVAGFQPQTLALSKGTNGWIWGNLIIGWIVGFVVDFATGSAYKLEPAQVQVTLVKQEDEMGILQTYGVVRQLDPAGRLISEQRVLLIPSR
jgi:hypothetical protein